MTRFPRTGLIALAAAGTLALGACSTSESGTEAAAGSETAATEGASASNDASEGTVTLTDNYGEKTVPSPPKRVVALDNRSFELLDSWGIKPVAAPRDIVPNSIPGIADDEDILNIGNHREPNLEAIVAADPDVIISGQRFEKFDEELQKLVPDATLLDFEPREGEPIDREIIRQTLELGDVFGKQAEAEQAVQEFTEAVQRARNAYDPEQKVMALNVSGGEIGYVAPGVGRVWGPLFDLIGFTPALEVANASDDHQGDDISVEAIADSDPDWIVVLDRDAAVSSEEGATPAAEVIEQSEALQDVTAVKEGNIYYAPADTYTNEGIQTYTEIFNGLADAFESKSS